MTRTLSRIVLSGGDVVREARPVHTDIPFVHAFTPAITPPWQTRTDFAAFHGIAQRSPLSGAAQHLGTARDIVAVPADA
jgi:nitrate reductase alpha subunit